MPKSSRKVSAAKNAFYAQSGGVTAVINATACGVIQTARKFGIRVFAGKNGILGALKEELFDTSQESAAAIEGLRTTPAGAFGSCRYKLKSIEENAAEYERLISVFKAHDIAYFFYNGGNDSQDTTYKISQMAKKMGHSLNCIGIPKTVDNDLVVTDNCPGFGSVAKYVAVSIKEAGLDIASMASSSTKVFIMEVMGRHAGWIAAAGGLAAQNEGESPHIILFPEILFDPEKFLKRVDQCVKKYDFCTIVVSEGLKDKEGRFLSEASTRDSFGHAQLGGVAPVVAQLIKAKLGYKYHWAVADYLQRAARHIASKTDVEQAYAVGKAAVEFAMKNKTDIMPVIVRTSQNPYKYLIKETPLKKVANKEKFMPKNFITKDGFHITQKCREYLQPLIAGEDYPKYVQGLPQYVKLKNVLVPKKLQED